MAAVIKKFSFSFVELSTIAGDLLMRMRQDAAEFAARGVSDTDINDLESLWNSFKVLQPDSSYYYEIIKEAEKKEEMYSAINKAIQYVSGFFQQKFGADSVEYKQLGIKGFMNFTTNNYIIAVRRTAAVAEDYLSVLSAVGLTQGDIDSLNSDVESFEQSVLKITELKKLRTQKARERVEKANELFSYVSQYSSLGKLIWRNRDEAKWKNYLIYRGRSKKYSKKEAADTEE